MTCSTLANDRIGVDADYETSEQFIPAAIPTKGVVLTGIDPKASQQLKNAIPRPEDFRLWETCMTIDNTWAYNKDPLEFKSDQTLIRSLVEVASRGGNFLLNVGPQPDGQIQPEFRQRLRAIGDWVTLNGDSIYGSTYGPVQGVAGLRTTANSKSIFVLIFGWSAPICEIAGIEARILSARLLANGKQLSFRQTVRPKANCRSTSLRSRRIPMSASLRSRPTRTFTLPGQAARKCGPGQSFLLWRAHEAYRRASAVTAACHASPETTQHEISNGEIKPIEHS